MIGRKLGHYRIVGQIGAGGMGVVYQAHDLRLDRDVALKVLPSGALADEAARRRFRHEALALSKLNHPNIETIHDFDSQEGVDFLVLEHIAGTTLDEKLAEGELGEKEVVKLGVQLMQGLEAAHAHGVVHRDLKPGNLRITPDGRLKILDFGLARLVRPAGEGTTHASLTAAGEVVGTLAYMAPEQLGGEKVDARADLYAAGAVLYELATGRRAFPQRSAPELMYAILNQEPEAPSTVQRGVSPGLEEIILKALAKDAELRYQSARELQVDLERLSAPAPVVARRRRRRVGRAALLAGGLALGLGAVAMFNPGGVRERLLRGPQTGTIQSLAVLPLENLSGDAQQEYFADGMTEELITALAKISALTVISRSSVMPFKRSHKTLGEIARALHVGAVIEGSVVQSADRVRITARLIQCATGKNLWAESYERDLRDILALQGDVALAIARQIQVKLTPQEQTRLARARRMDPAAHEAYLKGRYYFNMTTLEGRRKGMEYYQAAIRLDPGYALAYAGLAEAYWSISNFWLEPRKAMPLARAAAKRALELDPDLAEGHALYGVVLSFYDWKFAEGEKEFRRATELSPGSAIAASWYGYYLTNMGRFREARRWLLKALELDPLSANYRWFASWPSFYEGDYRQAAAQLEELVAAEPQYGDGHALLGETYEQEGEYGKALEALNRARSLGTHGWVVAAIGRVHAEVGRPDSARAVLRELAEMARHEYVTPYGVATVHAALGDKARAFEWLEKAYAERSEDLLLLKVDPRLRSLRSDPRYADLMRRVGFAG